ncbi:hypothetical protein TWF696_004644 [Orbilia brochopaga]|uniref:Fe2OG dioxygenase domain-containing protein n=1 Tax=Orbilia brochopaga TaxID=3140254 RepID=A0AAV9V7H5_9PEZI
MPGIRSRIKRIFATRKEPPRLDKGKARADSPPTPTSDTSDSDGLPVLHYSDLHLAPATLARSSAFYLVGHALPPAPLPQAKQLLTSPADIKKTLIHPRGSTVRGYNSAVSSGREWWDYSPENGGKNLTLDDEGFQAATRAYFTASIALLQEICAQFNSSPSSSSSSSSSSSTPTIPSEVITDVGFSTMRYLRYSPAVFPESSNTTSNTTSSTTNNTTSSTTTANNAKSTPSDPSSIPRMEAHTDHGILTLMTATAPSGLYIWDRTGQIYSAPPLSNAVLIIAGDLLAHFTALPNTNILDDGEKAVGSSTVLPTVHAVVMPPDTRERYSVAVFLRPRRELVVNRGKGGEVTFGRWAEEKGRIRGRRCWMVGQQQPQF